MQRFLKDPQETIQRQRSLVLFLGAFIATFFRHPGKYGLDKNYGGRFYNWIYLQAFSIGIL